MGAGLRFDAGKQGRVIEIRSIAAGHTYECLDGRTERSITAESFLDQLEVLAIQRGYPAVLWIDHRPTFVAHAMVQSVGTRIHWNTSRLARRGGPGTWNCSTAGCATNG